MTDSEQGNDNEDKQTVTSPEIMSAAEKAAQLDATVRAATDPPDAGQQPNANSQQPKAKRLDEMTILDLQKMDVNKLRGRCKAAGLSGKGAKDALIERLRPRVRRITRRYIEGVTTCAYCPADIMVTGTDKQPMADGRVMVTRQIKCKGKHNHKYPLKETVSADK